MSVQVSNEITVKVTCSKEELKNILNTKNFNLIHEFSLDDYYFIPNSLNIKNLSLRDILSKSILIRKVFENNSYNQKLTYKFKEFNSDGEILNQKTINCSIYDVDEAKAFLTAIGYKEIMNIKENDFVYSNNNFEIIVKDVLNGDLLIEAETESNTNYDTIDKLKLAILNIGIPIEQNQYFVKKAEIELNKILNRKENK